MARFRTRNGNDSTYVNAVTIGGRTVVSSAGGNDLFAVRESTFDRNVSINTGSGDDTLLALGQNAFAGRLVANGTSGSDRVETGEFTSFGRTPAIRNFEQNSIPAPDNLVDAIMQNLADAGLEDLLNEM